MSSHPRTASQRARPWRNCLLALLTFLSLLALIAWRTSLPARELAELPSAERHALYGRTLESLETVCRSHPANLEDFCRGQAELALRFAECDAVCRSLADPHLPHSSR
jgi:hypothetical protein